MSMEIISPRHAVEHKELCLEYDLKSGDGGYSFPCNEFGIIIDTNHQKRAKELDTDPDYEPATYRTYCWTYIEPAVGRCICGATVTLSSSCNDTCCDNCGRYYNCYGQELVPPEYWEEPWDEDYY